MIKFLIIDDNEIAPDNNKSMYTEATLKALSEEIGENGEVWQNGNRQYQFELDASAWEIKLKKTSDEWEIDRFLIREDNPPHRFTAVETDTEHSLQERFIEKIRAYTEDPDIDKLIIIMDLNLKQATEARSVYVSDNVRSGIWLATNIFNNAKIRFLFITKYSFDRIAEDSFKKIDELGVLCKKPGLCKNDRTAYFKSAGDAEPVKKCEVVGIETEKMNLINDLYKKKTRYYDLIGKVLESVWKEN